MPNGQGYSPDETASAGGSEFSAESSVLKPPPPNATPSDMARGAMPSLIEHSEFTSASDNGAVAPHAAVTAGVAATSTATTKTMRAPGITSSVEERVAFLNAQLDGLAASEAIMMRRYTLLGPEARRVGGMTRSTARLSLLGDWSHCLLCFYCSVFTAFCAFTAPALLRKES
jgi:hypothetical protein